jgi:alkylation response protein AidB-like acyl-CoA dehydrogenase
MSEYEIENIYRDSRINRIFEGTNEINRLLIPGTLMNKAQQGELPLIPAAMKLQEDLLTYMPSFEIAEGTLEEEEQLVENAKKIFLMVAGIAVETFQQNLKSQQEILRDLADIAIETFAMESALLRAKKAVEINGEDKEQAKIDLTKAYIYHSFPKVDSFARHALSAMEEGDMLRTQLSVLKKLTRLQPINEVKLKREIAKRLLAAEKYVV